MEIRMRSAELTAINPAYKTLATGTAELDVMWEQSFRGMELNRRVAIDRSAAYLPFYLPVCVRATAILLVLSVTATAFAFPVHRPKKSEHYGEGLIVNVPLPESEVELVVADVVQNSIIRGTKEYNKDEYVDKAVAAISTPVFPAWTGGGKVFYKVRTEALDPRNFQSSGDVGTLAVRYVLQPQGDKNTVLRINALFVEDFRRTVHLSNGSVEGAEYQDIQDRLQAVELVKRETEEALQAKQERATKQKLGANNGVISESNPSLSAKQDENTNRESVTADDANIPASSAGGSQSSGMPTSTTPEPSTTSAAYQEAGESLEKHVADLRREVEWLVKQPGAPLKSSPYHTASTLKSLEPGVEVLILISTPYWYGVETRDGQHGWIPRDQLEQRP
jgi:hypothetical protein